MKVFMNFSVRTKKLISIKVRKMSILAFLNYTFLSQNRPNLNLLRKDDSMQDWVLRLGPLHGTKLITMLHI